MPTCISEFDARTTGDTVVGAYPEKVKDKIIIITGANPGGVGYSAALSLAHAPPKVLIIAGRDHKRLSTVAQEITAIDSKVTVIPLVLDLSSQESCRKAAKQILEDPQVPHVDMLINNAGVMNIEHRTLSQDGLEMQFATNHIGHFLFTNLISPKLIKASQQSTKGSTRIINLSSRAVMYSPVRFSDHSFTKKQSELPEEERMNDQVKELWGHTEDLPYYPQAAYGQSKSANVLFSLQLNRLLFEKYGILSNAVHPGAVNTELSRHMDPEKLKQAYEKLKKINPNIIHKNLEEGCSTTLIAALDPNLGTEDLFLSDCQVADWAPAYCTDPVKADQLWRMSEDLIGQKFSY